MDRERMNVAAQSDLLVDAVPHLPLGGQQQKRHIDHRSLERIL
jgi:hypothetical protein